MSNKSSVIETPTFYVSTTYLIFVARITCDEAFRNLTEEDFERLKAF